MRSIARHAVALGSMLVGSTFVFGVVYWMNDSEKPPKLDTDRDPVAFQLEKKPPPKKKQEPKKRPTPKKRVRAAARAPMPNLAATLSGASFSLPGFENAGLGNVSQKLLGDTDEKLAMTEGAMDTPPRPLRRVNPEFPEKARRGGLEGYVKISVFVNQNGSVDRVRVLDAAPSGVFEQAAESAIRGWEFQPGVYQGESVAGWVTQTFRFKLEKTS